MVPSYKQLTFTSVGTTFTELPLTGMPDRFKIVRAKAEIKSGSGVTVALSVRRIPDASTSESVVLEYALVEELDYQEAQVVRAYKVRDIDLGQIFCAVKCDAGSDNTVAVLIEYQVI